MRPGRVVRLVFALSFLVFLGVGCGDSAPAPNADADKAVGAAPPPNRSPKAQAKMKSAMPHL